MTLVYASNISHYVRYSGKGSERIYNTEVMEYNCKQINLCHLVLLKRQYLHICKLKSRVVPKLVAQTSVFVHVGKALDNNSSKTL